MSVEATSELAFPAAIFESDATYRIPFLDIDKDFSLNATCPAAIRGSGRFVQVNFYFGPIFFAKAISRALFVCARLSV